MAKKDELDELDAIALMRERFHAAEEAEMLNRVAALEAIEFYYGAQWAADVKAARLADGRPAFTLNRLPAIVRQVLNEERADPPAIEIQPEGNGADDDGAEAAQGLARHVETHSAARDAYENAFEYMVIGGFGSWRVTHDYLPRSMDQELYVEPIINPFSVYWDPASKKLDKSDARFAFTVLDLSCDEHNDAYPDSELASATDFAGMGNLAPGWLNKDGARVVEYFHVETEDATLVQLVGGGPMVYDDQIPEGGLVALGPDGEPISRPDKRRTVYVAHSNGIEWLKKPKKLPTPSIPLVSVFGERLIVNGEMRIKGMVEDLMEPARMFNYNSSAVAETTSNASKDSWVATAEQVEPYQNIWAASSTRRVTVLPYKNMQGVAPPYKPSTEPPIQAISAARQQSADDLRAISGVYDATQSPNGGEESGRAILARRHQARTGNNHFSQNLRAGVKRTAEILLEYFPIIYDAGRVMRIIGKDQNEKQIMVHGGRPETVPAELPENVKAVIDLSRGNYAVTIGRAYDTMREETVEMMLSLVAAEPALAPILADLIVNEMSFPGKSAFVERLKRALPANLQDNDNPTDPQQLQAHNGMLMQQNQKLIAQIQQLATMVKNQTVQAQSREKIEAMKLRATAINAQVKLDAERLKARSAILLKKADAEFTIAHDHALADKKHVHDVMHASHAAKLKPVKPQPGEGFTQ